MIGQLAAQIDALKRQARQAVRYRTVAQQVRKAEATLFHLRWVAAKPSSPRPNAPRISPSAWSRSAPASRPRRRRRQALAAAELPALRDAEAKAAAALQRLVMARETLEREEARAKERMAELDRRLIQLGDDIEREQRLAVDAQAALGRLAAEDETFQREIAANATQRAGVEQQVAEADEIVVRGARRRLAPSPSRSPTSPRGAMRWRTRCASTTTG